MLPAISPTCAAKTETDGKCRESCRRGKIEDAGHITLYVCASVYLRAHVVVYVRGCVGGGRCWPQMFFPVAIALFLETGSLAEPGVH